MRDERPNNRTLKLQLLSQWKLEAESRNKAFLQHHIVYTGQSHAVKIYLSGFKFAVSLQKFWKYLRHLSAKSS